MLTYIFHHRTRMRDLSKSNQIKTAETWNKLGIALAILLVVCITYPLVLYTIMHSIRPDALTKCGLFGDMFGALNAFISGCAFCGVIFSLYQQKIQLELQREDLKLQRNDLALQREEMQKAREEAERQTEQFEAQVKIGKDSQFADDFYRRLELLNTLQSAIVYTRLLTLQDLIRKKNSQQPPAESKGIIAWQKIHNDTMRYLSNKSDIQTVIDHTEALPSIIAWHASISALIKDTIEHFNPQWRHSYREEKETKEKHYIRILLISLSLYQKDFLILLFDAMEDSEIRDVKSYLYNNAFLSKENKTDNPFATDSDNRNNLLHELRERFSR